MDYQIIIAGFGGQGILFAGKALAYSGLEKQKQVSWLPSYGPEMRGGTANCSVCISDEPIGSPLVTDPDILVAMNTPSFYKFIDHVKPNGKVFVDSSMGEVSSNRGDIEIHHIPVSQLAEDNNLNGMANVILMGRVISDTNMFSYDEIKLGLEESIPQSKKNLLDSNLQAVSLGINYVEN